METGKWEYYHENGQYGAGGNYEAGKRTGEWKIYKENGKLEEDAMIENGKTMEGKSYRYHDNEKLEEVRSYIGDVDGDDTDTIDHGEFKSYYENGQLEEIGMHENDEKTGEWKEYDDDGTLIWIGKYENGNLISEEDY